MAGVVRKLNSSGRSLQVSFTQLALSDAYLASCLPQLPDAITLLSGDSPSPFTQSQFSLPNPDLRDPNALCWSSRRSFSYAYTSPSAGYIDFRSLNSPSDVVASVRAMSNYLQMRHVSAALSRLKRFPIDFPREILEEVSSFGMGTIGSTRPDDVVAIFSACAKMRFLDPDLMNALAKRAVDFGYASNLTSRQLATLVHCIGVLIVLSRRSVSFWEKKFESPVVGSEYGCLPTVEEFLRAIIDEIAVFRKVDEDLKARLPSIVSSLALFDRRDERLDRILAVVIVNTENLSETDETGLTNTVLTLFKTGTDEDLFKHVCNEIVKGERLACFKWEQMKTIMETIFTMKYKEKAFWEPFFGAMFESDRMREYEDTDFLSVVSKAYELDVLDSWMAGAMLLELARDARRDVSALDLARILPMFGMVGVEPDEMIIPLLERVCEPSNLEGLPMDVLAGFVCGCHRLQFPGDNLVYSSILEEASKIERLVDFDVKSMTFLLHSSTRAGWYDNVVHPKLLTECLRQHHLAKLGPTDVTNLTLVISKTKKSDLSISLEPYFARVNDLVKKFKVSHLANLLHLWGKVGHYGDKAEGVIQEFGKSDRLRRAVGRDVAAAVLAMARLNAYNKEVVDKICERIMRKMSNVELNGREAIALMYGLAVLQHRDEELMAYIVPHIFELEDMGTLSTMDLHKILSSFVMFDSFVEPHAEDVVTNLLETRHLSKSSIDHLCDLVIAMDKLNFRSTKWVEKIGNRIGELKERTYINEKQLDKLHKALVEANFASDDMMDMVKVGKIDEIGNGEVDMESEEYLEKIMNQ